MKVKMLSKLVVGSVLPATLLSCALFSATASADNLTPQDAMVTTIFDKSVLSGSLAHDANGNLLYDTAGNARFQYSGQVYAVQSDAATGSLKALGNQIGTITGEAAFPKEFVGMTAGVNSYMSAVLAAMNNGTAPPPMGPMPAIVNWTCNHCDMTVGDSELVSIKDVLSEYLPDGVTPNPFYNEDIANQFKNGTGESADQLVADLGMHGRAFTGLGPASFDPVSRTMSVRMAGCSAVVGISGSQAGKVGTLCMNSTATFNVGGAIMDPTSPNGYGYSEASNITANGSSNCVTVLQPQPQQ